MLIVSLVEGRFLHDEAVKNYLGKMENPGPQGRKFLGAAYSSGVLFHRDCPVWVRGKVHFETSAPKNVTQL
jgi:hypothetical protein